MNLYNPFKPHLVKVHNEFYAVRKYSIFGCCYYYSDKLESWNVAKYMNIIVRYCYFKEYERAQEIYYKLSPRVKVL